MVLDFIRENVAKTLGIIVLGIISNVLTIMIPVSIGKYYQLVFQFDAYRVKLLGFVPDWLWNTVPKFLLAFSLLVLFRYLFFYLYQSSLRNQAERFIKQTKDWLFRHQLEVNYTIYKEKGIGKYLLRYSGDINSLKNLYLKGSVSVIVDAFMILIALYWLYRLNPKGALAIIILSGICYLVLRILNTKVESYSLMKRNKTSGQLSFVSRSLDTILGIVLFNKQGVELKKYKKKSEGIMETAMVYNRWLIATRGFISFFQYFILAVILYFFYLDLGEYSNVEAGGNLITFILLYITILPVIRRLFLLDTVYKLGRISVNKLNNVLDLEQDPLEVGEELEVKNPRVEFNEVQFGGTPTIDFYSEKMAVSHLSLPEGISSWDIIAALSRINDSYEGTIQINKEDIREKSPRSLRAAISFLSVQVPLTGRTVYEALTEFRSKKIKASVTERYEELVQTFPNIPALGIDDPIGEKGVLLSRIQYEFLCFARGIMADRKIIIADAFPLLEVRHSEVIENVLKKQEATVIVLSS